MRGFVKVIAVVGLYLINTNCANDVYSRKSKSHSKSQKSYSKIDTLVIKNYALYNSREEVLLVKNKKPFEVNKDSLVAVFRIALDQLNLKNLKVEVGNNFIDSTFYVHPIVKIKDIDISFLNSISGNTNSSPVLVPFIFANNKFQFTGFFTSTGGFGNNGWNSITWLHLIVFVIKKNDIIYSRHFRYKSNITWADTRQEIEAIPPLAAVKQEHWDELVRLAMEDYMKRLK